MLLASILLAATLRQQLAAIVQPLGSTAGIAVVDLPGGTRTLVRGDERFPMGSVYKLPIALTVLRQVDEGKVFLTDDATITPDRFAPGWSPLRDAANGKPIKTTVGALLQQMVSVSDNTASDYLLDLAGGGPVVTKRMRELGVQNIRIDRRERDIAADIEAKGAKAYVKDVRDTATPAAMADLLVKLAKSEDGLSAESHEVLLRAMTETKTGLNRIRAGIPAEAQLAHKTGSMPLVINDAGLITKPDGRQLVLVVFTKGGKATDEAREAAIAKIARAAYSM
ncbi:MAG TPA: class A beta-lactamase [Thermoanaerobaculia bacterium]|jgi:beta-lactamase class A|nr:class A beta-lactamase [Thermoanaerobaculia bacterium]